MAAEGENPQTGVFGAEKPYHRWHFRANTVILRVFGARVVGRIGNPSMNGGRTTSPSYKMEDPNWRID